MTTLNEERKAAGLEEIPEGGERPQPLILSGPELAAKRERLIAEADAAALAKAKAETAELLGQIEAMAARHVARFVGAPCGGELAGIQVCTRAVWEACELRDEASCPRRIQAFDAAREAARLAERLADAGIPQGLLPDALNPKPTDATARIDLWIPAGSRLLVLAGKPGVGKSVAAAYAIRRYRGTWTRASTIGAAQGFDSEHRASRQRWINTRLLVVDDLGSEREHARSAVEELVAERYDEGVRTILTTNLDAKAFKAAYTGRIVDRIAADGPPEEGGFRWIGGPSLRGAKR